MALDWSAPLCTSHNPPRLAEVRYQEKGIRGVMVLGDSQMPLRPELRDRPPTYRYNEVGCCHVMGEPNDFDLVNYDRNKVSPIDWVRKA